MRRLTYENSRGEKIIFYLSPFLIESLEGIAEIDVEIQSQTAPYQDGATYIGTVLQPRYISLEGSIATKNRIEIRKYRREVSRICNPKLGLGLITLELDGDLKQIHGTLDGGVVFPDRGRDPWQPFMITWKCPNPYWQSPEIIEEPMAAFVELFEFSSDYWEVGPNGELFFEMGIEGEKRTFTIEGDAESPVQIKFNGPSTNPVVRNNTTGEFIKINRTLDVGDTLFIDTSNQTVEINGVNAFNWIDLNSTFWKLQVGENEIEYTADAGAEEAELMISWQEQYVSV